TASPASGGASHQEKPDAEKFPPVSQACQAVIVEKIAGKPHHEKVTWGLVEDQVWHHSAVGAAQDRRDGKLRCRTRGAAGGKISLARAIGHVARVSFHQALQCRVGSDGAWSIVFR